jgi:flagellar export protein FliJ
MASDLTVLIRLHKHELDEKRLALGEFYFALTQVERERRELEHSFAREKEVVDTTGDIHFTFPKYVEKVRRQRGKLDAREALLEKQIEAAKDSLMETFSELKKYEMTQEERHRLAEEERSIKESKELDEIGLEAFRRKDDE